MPHSAHSHEFIFIARYIANFIGVVRVNCITRKTIRFWFECDWVSVCAASLCVHSTCPTPTESSALASSMRYLFTKWIYIIYTHLRVSLAKYWNSFSKFQSTVDFLILYSEIAFGCGRSRLVEHTFGAWKWSDSIYVLVICTCEAYKLNTNGACYIHFRCAPACVCVLCICMHCPFVDTKIYFVVELGHISWERNADMQRPRINIAIIWPRSSMPACCLRCAN